MLLLELMLRISAALLFAGQATVLAEEFAALIMTAWSIIAELLASGALILMLIARTLIISRTLAALIVVKASARLVTGGFEGLLIVAQTLAMTVLPLLFALLAPAPIVVHQAFVVQAEFASFLVE